MCFTDLAKYLGYKILQGPQALFEIFDPEKDSLNSNMTSIFLCQLCMHDDELWEEVG